MRTLFVHSTCKSLESPTMLGRPIAKLGGGGDGVAFEGGLKGRTRFVGLNTFIILLTLTGFFKLPSLTLICVGFKK